MPNLTIISDVHGEIDKYIELTKKTEYTIQVGDLAFDYSRILKEIDPNFHKHILGNHDNYIQASETLKSGHNLGDFGLRNHGGLDIFVIRGEHSIDCGQRTPWVDWFPNEQLNYVEGMKCIEEYSKIKPDIVIAHGCPESVLFDFFPDRSVLTKYGYREDWVSCTSILLQQCLDIHRPALFVFGHHHRKLDREVKGTRFRCMYELGTIEI